MNTDHLIEIKDLETLRVISDTLRLKIFRVVGKLNQQGMFCSVKQISEELDMPPVKLYYHIRLLENHGLLQVAETRVVSGIVEKLYRAPGLRLSIAREMFDKGDETPLVPMFSGLLNQVLDDLQQLLAPGQPDVLRKSISIGTHTLRLRPTRVEAVGRQIEQFIQELEAKEEAQTQEALRNYTFFFVCYPDQEPRRLKDGLRASLDTEDRIE